MALRTAAIALTTLTLTSANPLLLPRSMTPDTPFQLLATPHKIGDTPAPPPYPLCPIEPSSPAQKHTHYLTACNTQTAQTYTLNPADKALTIRLPSSAAPLTSQKLALDYRPGEPFKGAPVTFTADGGEGDLRFDAADRLAVTDVAGEFESWWMCPLSLFGVEDGASVFVYGHSSAVTEGGVQDCWGKGRDGVGGRLGERVGRCDGLGAVLVLVAMTLLVDACLERVGAFP